MLDDTIKEDTQAKQWAINAAKLEIRNKQEEEGLLDGVDDLEEDPRLTDTQKQLIREIREKFDPEDKVADLCILYEVTLY